MVVTNDVLAAGMAPPALIDAPPLTLPPLSLPQIARFLIDEEAGIDPTEGRWQAGVTFRREPTRKAGGWAPCGNTDIDLAEDCDSDLPPVYLPFFATYVSRSPLSQYQTADYQGRAQRGLRAHEAYRVEHEFWTGELQPNNPFLSRAVGLTGAGGYDAATPGAPVGLRDGISMLDQAIADADVGIGMIHVTPFLLESLATRGGLPLQRENGKIVTVNGNWIVPGYGYEGTGHDSTGGRDTEIQWAYATDMIYLGRGTINDYPKRFPVDFTGTALQDGSDFAQSLVDVGSEIPMAAAWVSERPWVYLSNSGLRAGIKINASVA